MAGTPIGDGEQCQLKNIHWSFLKTIDEMKQIVSQGCKPAIYILKASRQKTGNLKRLESFFFIKLYETNWVIKVSQQETY